MVMTGGKRREMKKQNYTRCVALCRTRALSVRICCRNAIRYYATGRGIACRPTRNVRPSLCRCNGDGLCSVWRAENGFIMWGFQTWLSWPQTSVGVAVPGQSVHTVSVTVTGVSPLSVSFHHCCILSCILTFWRRNYFFLILAHPVYKMWIIQEPNTLELWNKLHFEEKKAESIYRV